MSKRTKQRGAEPDRFLFTVPIIGPESRTDDAQTLIEALTETEAASRRAPSPRIVHDPSPDALYRQRRMDQVVAGASAAALLLSIALLRQIAPSPSAQTAWVLAAGWAALLAALVSALAHHHLGQRAHANRVTDWDRTFRGTDPVHPRGGSLPRPWLALAASASLVAGLVSLAVFAFLNADFA